MPLNLDSTQIIVEISDGIESAEVTKTLIEAVEIQLIEVEAAEIQLIIVAEQGPPGIGGTGVVLGEELTGTINNSNATFTTQYDFVPGKVVPKVNGIAQSLLNDFNTSGTTTIVFYVSPEIGDKLTVDYERA